MSASRKLFFAHVSSEKLSFEGQLRKNDCGANTCVKYGLGFAFYCGFTVCHFGDFAFSRVLRAVGQKVAFWLKTAPPR